MLPNVSPSMSRIEPLSESGADSSKNARLKHTISEGFLRELYDLKSTGTLCDVVLKGSEESAAGIPCHRVVLCAHSSYFRTMFTSEWKEKYQAEVQLKNIPGGPLSELVNFAYTMEISIHEQNVHNVLTAAIFLDIIPVAKMCWEFVEDHLDASSCLMIHCLAEKHKNGDLTEKAKAMVLRHFVPVSQSADFLLIDAQKVVELVASDALHVEKEDEVLQAVKRWFDHDPAGRKAHFSDILQFIRVTFLGPQCLDEYFLALLNSFITTPGAESSVRSGNIKDLDTLDVTELVWRYNPTTNEWQEVAPVQVRRSCHGVAALNGRIYAAGGCHLDVNDEFTKLSSVECFDPQTNSWQFVAALPVALDDVAMVAFKDRLYLFGGDSGESEAVPRLSNKLFCYDPVLNAWSELADMPTARRWCSACISPSGLIYLMGGDVGEPEKCVRCTEAYDPATNKWLKRG
ncbi:kelch-like protein diablo [Paramacrobiotus metropolitanus]|uniref:kelch-like protein diablo n=1 Tax=Paramacrobiotus metropolitanus TaxID=2943436 RepID=UPI00244564F8|nr:kelch-like protein diablo [Paramacrobiotus metropolitanus]